MDEKRKRPAAKRPPLPPIIYEDKCIGCGTCIQFCKEDVLETDPATGKPRVKNPWNCPVGCRTCARLCPTSAATFQDEEFFISYLKKRLSSRPCTAAPTDRRREKHYR